MFNKVVLVGNLTRDIELRYLQNGSAVGKSAIAVTRKYNSNGEKKKKLVSLILIFGVKPQKLQINICIKEAKS